MTPAMIIGENNRLGVPDLYSLDSINMSHRTNYRRKLSADLRIHVRAEYQGQLSIKQSQNTKFRDKEVVLIWNDNQKRLNCPLDRIIELIPVRDGRVRGKNSTKNSPLRNWFSS